MEPVTDEYAYGQAAESSWLTYDPSSGHVPLLVDVVQSTKCVVVRLVGELDTATIGRAEGIATEALAGTPARRFVIDVSEVSFCGSCGLALLMSLTRRARLRGIDALVRRPQPL